MTQPMKSSGARQRIEARFQNIRPQSIASPSTLLLARLKGVIKTGKGWRARCPHCGGKGHKLSIAEGDNGTLLVTCFSCHDTAAVLAAVGLQVGDLFARKDLRSMSPAERSQLRQAALLPRWRAATEVLSHEATVLLIAANRMGDGEALDDAELTRLRVAALKVFDAAEVLTHGR
ncbi:hypothetical protein CS053_15245 [Rhodanobacter glycinis]|uniref:DNA primase n=1 Tax=Rhodanobacter glycinis TaxID=582702 RepID=A0A5B9E637_9GAMM|nr:hypothetical protein [Rhodanobacter glycinis]QEE25707.1 hypothetical protein CS053_15245 [Rhodanobacter glycinis]